MGLLMAKNMLSVNYTQSLPIRKGDKFQWVRFLYFPDFWMVFISYLYNFLWFPFLKFKYLFKRHKHPFLSYISNNFSNIAFVSFNYYQPFDIFLTEEKIVLIVFNIIHLSELILLVVSYRKRLRLHKI